MSGIDLKKLQNQPGQISGADAQRLYAATKELDQAGRVPVFGTGGSPSFNEAMQGRKKNLPMPAEYAGGIFNNQAFGNAAISGEKTSQIRSGLLGNLNNPATPQMPAGSNFTQGLEKLLMSPALALFTPTKGGSFGEAIQNYQKAAIQSQLLEDKKQQQAFQNLLALRKAGTEDILAQASLQKLTNPDLPAPVEVTVDGVKQIGRWDKRNATWRGLGGTPIKGDVQLVPTDSISKKLALYGIAPNTPFNEIPDNIKDRIVSPDKVTIENQQFDTRGEKFKRQQSTIKYGQDQINNLLKDKSYTEFLDSMNNYDLVAYNTNNPSALGDISLIFSFFKAIDPKSTVREGEFELATGATGFTGAVKRSLNKFFTGEGLDNKSRQILLDFARKTVNDRSKGVLMQIDNVQKNIEEYNAPLPVDERRIADIKNDPRRFKPVLDRLDAIKADSKTNMKNFFRRSSERISQMTINANNALNNEILTTNPNVANDLSNLNKTFRFVDKDGNEVILN